MDYVVINNSNSHINILLNKETKQRVSTSTTYLYNLLSSKIDVVETITKKVTKMQQDDVIKSIQSIGREQNKALKKVAYLVFDTIGWDQYQFDIGFDYVKETFYDRIPEDIKYDYAGIIEEAFYTMSDRNQFYQFLRNFTEGNVKAKEHMTELLKDILYGIEFTQKINAYYNDTYGEDEVDTDGE